MKLSEAIRIQKPKLPSVAVAVEDCFRGDISLSEFGKPEMSQLRKYISGRMCQNSARVYLANIKAVLNIYKDEGELKCRDFDLLTVKSEATVSVFLDSEELKQLEKYMRKCSAYEKFYILHFLCSAYTGCRVSDVRGLSRASIRKGMLAYVSEKTGIKAEVPAKKGLKTWLELIDTAEMSRFEFSLTIYNRLIKQVCRKAGIDAVVSVHKAGKTSEGPKWQYVSSHTARRSFATNLYLAGLDLYSIGKMMGHTSTEMTQRYICCGLRELSPEVMRYFE